MSDQTEKPVDPQAPDAPDQPEVQTPAAATQPPAAAPAPAAAEAAPAAQGGSELPPGQEDAEPEVPSEAEFDALCNHVAALTQHCQTNGIAIADLKKVFEDHERRLNAITLHLKHRNGFRPD